MGQISFLIVFLFSFGKGECCVALYAGDFDVWHDSFSPRPHPLGYVLICFGAAIESSLFAYAVNPLGNFILDQHFRLLCSEGLKWRGVYSTARFVTNGIYRGNSTAVLDNGFVGSSAKLVYMRGDRTA